MKKYKDLCGQKFGRLLVLSREIERRSSRSIYWYCLCDCGNKKIIAGSSLKAINGTKSCGCLKVERQKKRAKNYAGHRFGRLTVLSRDLSKRKDHNPHWKCICDCGIETVTSIGSLKKGETTSCGCFQLEIFTERFKKINIKNKGESAANSIAYRYKYNANLRDLEFKLTDLEFKNLIFNNCFYCNAIPSNNSKNRYGNGDVIYNGIDRVNDLIGYQTDNCVTCCKNCNRAKYKMSHQEFMNWVNNIYKTSIIVNSQHD
jgi:hypothetical protein